MNQEEEEGKTIYKVVVNHEEQYSIWPDHREIPLGWKAVGKVGTKAECLAYVEEVWTDTAFESEKENGRNGAVGLASWTKPMTHKSFDEFRVVEFSTDKQQALFATRTYAVGDEIYPMDYWSQEVMPMHLTNHSCDPNGRFNDAGMLLAIRYIAADEEITYDYLAHPLPASPWNFECLCGTTNCRGRITAS